MPEIIEILHLSLTNPRRKQALLIDIGVNLTHASFQKDRAAVIDRALAAGVGQMVITGTTIRNSQDALHLARTRAGALFATAGVHPHNAKTCTEETLKLLGKLAAEPEVVAIGECGLDYNRDFSPRPVQDKWFEAQIELAAECKLPLFLHERDAHSRFVGILKQHRSRFDKVVVHCFTGTVAEAKVYLDLDLHLGITGWICDERRGQHLREVVRQIPLNRLMLETDAPFLTPRTIQPKPKDGRNEPGLLPHVLRAVAQAIGKPEAAVATSTTATTREFFSLGSVQLTG
ncbi:MAG: TatD family hydrolase [Blastocatellia bacterium]|nr:TatD family hydrolase [Blastocatellia bacterium]